MERLYAEQIKQLYKQIPIGLTATVVNSLVLVILLWNVISSTVLSVWFAASVILAALRYLSFLKFTRLVRSAQQPAEFRKYEIGFNLGIALSGIIWGSAGIFLFPANSLPHQVLIAFVTGGMVAGAAGTFSIIMNAFLAFSLPALLPVIIRFFLVGDPVRIGMGCMTLLFGGLMYLTAKRVHQAVVLALTLQFENSDLIERLEDRVKQRTAELAAANEATQRLNENLELRVIERTQLAEQRAKQLRGLMAELTLAEHQERRRLAGILHDHLQQFLVAAKMKGEILCGQIRADQKPPVENILNLITQSLSVSRSLTAELSPPVLQNGSLSAALEWLAEWMRENHELAVELQTDPDVDPKRKDITILLFQSARELLFNVVKHAGVRSARVAMNSHEGGLFSLTVSDRGMGFNPETLWEKPGSGLGLLSIRERLTLLGGSIRIESSPGKGATFTLMVPRKMQEEEPGET